MPDKDKDKNRVRVQVVEESNENNTEDEHAEPEKHEEHEPEERENHEEHEEHEHHEEHKELEESLKPEHSNYPKQDKIPFWILFFAFLIGLTLGAGLIGGIFYYRSKVGKLEVTTISDKKLTSEETTEASPTPTVEEKLDLSKYSVQILNGSGIAGEAGRVETLLKTAGFSNTKVGNAGSYNFTDTEVAIKKDFPSTLFEEIQKDLSSYQLKLIDSLESNSAYDIIITVGKTKK